MTTTVMFCNGLKLSQLQKHSLDILEQSVTISNEDSHISNTPIGTGYEAME